MAIIPYMPFYVADYVADTMHLTGAESGAYLHLILAYWQQQRALPLADNRLAAMAKISSEEWVAIRPSLEEFFFEQDGCWHHKRIESELQKFYDKTEQSRRAGIASGRKRKNTENIEETNDRCDSVRTESEQKGNDRSTPVAIPLQQNGNQTETETETEELKSFVSPPNGKKPKRSANPASGTRLDIAELPDEWKAWAVADCGWTDAHALRIWENFLDYWKAAVGVKARKADWEATWRGWCRRDNSPQMSLGTAVGKNVRPFQQQRETTTEAALRIVKERVQKYGRL